MTQFINATGGRPDYPPSIKNNQGWTFSKNENYNRNLCKDRCIQTQALGQNEAPSEACQSLLRVLKGQMEAIFRPDWQSILQNNLCNETDRVFVYPNYKLCQLKGDESVGRASCYFNRSTSSDEFFHQCRRECREEEKSNVFVFENFDLDPDQAASQEIKIKENGKCTWTSPLSWCACMWACVGKFVCVYLGAGLFVCKQLRGYVCTFFGHLQCYVQCK